MIDTTTLAAIHSGTVPMVEHEVKVFISDEDVCKCVDTAGLLIDNGILVDRVNSAIERRPVLIGSYETCRDHYFRGVHIKQKQTTWSRAIHGRRA